MVSNFQWFFLSGMLFTRSEWPNFCWLPQKPINLTPGLHRRVNASCCLEDAGNYVLCFLRFLRDFGSFGGEEPPLKINLGRGGYGGGEGAKDLRFNDFGIRITKHFHYIRFPYQQVPDLRILGPLGVYQILLSLQLEGFFIRCTIQ